MTERWTAGQYSLYRALLGAFLCIHFGALLPYAAEVFGAGGAVATSAMSPLMGLLPNPLAWCDGPVMVSALCMAGMLAALALTVGWADRVAALACAAILAWLFARNPLIANPSLPLLGWMLVAHAFTPHNAYGSLSAWLDDCADPRWRLPPEVFTAAWVVLAVSYSYSGYTKLLSPTWVSGDAIAIVLDNPLARDHALRTTLLALPETALRCLTWAVLWVEVLFAPLALFARMRPWLWLAMLLAQVGFLVLLDFADLTVPMLLAHLLTFDPAWVASKSGSGQAILLFDGECRFCNALVRMTAYEDVHGRLRLGRLQDAPMGNDTLDELRKGGDSIGLIGPDGVVLLKSRAVAGVLRRLGGLWTIAGALLQRTPRRFADRAYDAVGRVRYRIGGRVSGSGACALVPEAVAGRYLDGPGIARLLNDWRQ